MLKVGDFVKVDANSQGNGTLVALKIHLMDAKTELELEGAIQHELQIHLRLMALKYL